MRWNNETHDMQAGFIAPTIVQNSVEISPEMTAQ